MVEKVGAGNKVVSLITELIRMVKEIVELEAEVLKVLQSHEKRIRAIEQREQP